MRANVIRIITITITVIIIGGGISLFNVLLNIYFYLFLFCFIVEGTLNMLLLTNVSIQHIIDDYRSNVVEQDSRIYSSCLTETSRPLVGNSPFLLPEAPATTIPLFGSMILF